MQASFLNFSTRTAVAMAIGAGGLLAASTAHAVVVLSGPVNIVVPATTAGVYLNVVTGANSTVPASAPGWDINPWSSTGLGFFNPASPTGGVYVVSAPTTVANLGVGATVGAASTFGSQGSTPFAQWNLNSSNNYFGFRFTNEAGGTLHYGWAQLEIGSTIATRSIVQYAFESVPNTAITVVPEPGTYLMMGLGLAGLLAARRRQQQR